MWSPILETWPLRALGKRALFASRCTKSRHTCWSHDVCCATERSFARVVAWPILTTRKAERPSIFIQALHHPEKNQNPLSRKKVKVCLARSATRPLMLSILYSRCLLWNEGLLANNREADTMALALREEKASICKVSGKHTGGTAQICLLIQSSGQGSQVLIVMCVSRMYLISGLYNF